MMPQVAHRRDALRIQSSPLPAFGVVASLWWTFAAISGMQSYWPFISAPDPYGAIAKQLCYSAMLNALVAAAGALWHIWATLEHKKKL
jgi:hypothetical protein